MDKCINWIHANVKHCEKLLKESTTLVTAFNPYIGYKASTKLSDECFETDRGIYDLILEKKILSKEQVDLILKPENLIKPVKLDINVNKTEEKK